MPVFFICFILFIIWMNVKSKQENKKNSTWNEEFWEKERKANFVRKKNIEDLDYIIVTENDLPFSATAAGEEKDLQEQVRNLLSQKMLNLSGKSNTDLKLEYGTANFSTLSEYDQNYTLLIRSLGQWGSFLHKNVPGADIRARQILEYAISLGSDITGTYLSLAEIYLADNDIEKIQQLMKQVDDSEFYMKESIIRQLKDVIRSYN
ncbi:MAG: hypothetical protein J6K58_09240 [Lachnospiraceae bacterium]|nr:hypothetical protein [Lachnospiraceae bacterium]